MLAELLLASSVGLNLSSIHLGGEDLNEDNKGLYLVYDNVEFGVFNNSYNKQTKYVTYNFNLAESTYVEAGSFIGLFDYSGVASDYLTNIPKVGSLLLGGGVSLKLGTGKLRPVIKYLPTINLVTFQLEYKL